MFDMSRPSLARLGVGLVAAALALSACSGPENPASAPSSASTVASSESSVAPVKDGAAQVTITLTGNELKADFLSAPAGPVTFTVSNVDAAGLTEFELLSDQRIIGEKESLAPGLPAVSFTATLTGGTYQLYSPGADNEKQTFTVTGEAKQATGDLADLLTQGAKDYAEFVDTQLDGLVDGAKKLDAAIQEGDVAGAKTAYLAMRPFYEKVESDVEGFVLPGADPTDNSKNLDYLIDMRESNLDPDVGWHGMHAVERDLWQAGKVTDATKKTSTELLANITKLRDVATTLTYKPEDLANGAASLLEEVQSNKITGEEEAFSHSDLVDFNANVEGARQAYASLKPGLDKLDPDLSQQISTQFDTVTTALDEFRDAKAPGGFRPWTADERAKSANKLSQSVQALQDPLARVAQKVATAQ